MAGRSLDKLKSVRDAIGAPSDTPLVVADAGDPASLKAMVDDTKSVITTVGPYQNYGNELLATCVASGVDYFDLCGEPIWMHQMIGKHEAAAQASGARIMFSCGYDSVPFELGTFFVQKEAKRVFGAPAARVKGRVRDMRGTLSGGTAASAKATFEAVARDLSLVQILNNHFALTPGFEGPKQPKGNKPLYEEDMQSWTAPFMMADDQHAQRPSLQHADGLSLRKRLRLRRDGADRARRERRGQRQEGDGSQFRQDRPEGAQAGRGAVEGGARERSLRSPLYCHRARRPPGARRA